MAWEINYHYLDTNPDDKETSLLLINLLINPSGLYVIIKGSWFLFLISIPAR